jgi:BioD-like phosphotransacetylase family protein
VPILVVRDDIYKVARNVENMIGQLRLHESHKIDHGIKLVHQKLNFKKLYEMLNLMHQRRGFRFIMI